MKKVIFVLKHQKSDLIQVQEIDECMACLMNRCFAHDASWESIKKAIYKQLDE